MALAVVGIHPPLPTEGRFNMLTATGKRTVAFVLGLAILAGAALLLPSQPLPGKDDGQRPRLDPPPVATDKTLKYDYDIVYVRAPRVVTGADGKERPAPVWPNASEPENL